jgi:hypothetical protein
MTIYKQPIEQVPAGVDFSGVLPAGETIQEEGSDVTVVDSGGEDQTNDMLVLKVITTTRIDAVVKGGTSGGSYQVEFYAKTQKYLFEEDIDLQVRTV